MTDSSATQPPGWYYAQGDPPGTQRYWDGSQWVGGPQAAQGGSPEAGGGYNPVAGGVAAPAEYGTRAVAWLVDFAIFFGIGLVAWFLSFGDGFIGLLSLLVYLAQIGFAFYNWVFQQGSTGQTIGKSTQNLKLVADDTGQPVGIVMALVRSLIITVFYVACVVPVLIDMLWPLWDNDKKRLTDKILSQSVVPA